MPRSVNHHVDIHIGKRLRLKRKELGLSQSALGECAGITFQQVQKYEHGANRISVSTLLEFASFLKTPVGWFLEGLDQTSG